MRKEILFAQSASDKIMKGINVMADAVSVTLGANGETVIISNGFVADYGMQRIPLHCTKDGITVARSVYLEDSTENVGAMLLREASQKTADQAGDGTTTTIVLAREIAQEGLKAIAEASANRMEVRRGIDHAVEKVVGKLKEMATPIKDDIERIRQIATISANNDPFIGDLIAEAFEKMGPEGIIDIEEAKSTQTSIKITDGFKFKNGFISSAFINNAAKAQVELNNPYILLYDKAIDQIKSLERIMQEVVPTGRPLLIICDDMGGDALAFLCVNNIKKICSVCVVKSPFYADIRREAMEDIAVCTGADYVGDLKGIAIENAGIINLGSAKRVIVTKESTSIIEGEKSAKGEYHEALLNDVRMNLAVAEGDEEKAKIEARIARLTSKTAIISVGAATETEMKEKKDRCDDAVRATKSAISEGYLPGAGYAFHHIRQHLKSSTSATKDFQLGESLLYSSLDSPLKQLCKNAGIEYNKINHEIHLSKEENAGYDALKNEVGDLLAAGIVDPVKVLRCSIQNAASVAGMFLTTGCTIADCF